MSTKPIVIPITPDFLFCYEHYGNVAKWENSTNSQSIKKFTDQVWNLLPEFQKRPYVEQYRQEMKLFQGYLDNMSPLSIRFSHFNPKPERRDKIIRFLSLQSRLTLTSCNFPIGNNTEQVRPLILQCCFQDESVIKQLEFYVGNLLIEEYPQIFKTVEPSYACESSIQPFLTKDSTKDKDLIKDVDLTKARKTITKLKISTRNTKKYSIRSASKGDICLNPICVVINPDSTWFILYNIPEIHVCEDEYTTSEIHVCEDEYN